MKTWTLALLLAMVGCGKNTKVSSADMPDSEGPILIEQTAEDKPTFKRIYYAKISPQVTLKVTMQDRFGSLMKNGELDQSGGRWVLFDPDAVAEKILDPILVPIVQRYCDQIQKTDANWRASEPKEYLDESGTKWVRP